MKTGGWPFTTQRSGTFHSVSIGPNTFQVQNSIPDGGEVIDFLLWFSPNFSQTLRVTYDDGSTLLVYKVGSTYQVKGFSEAILYSKRQLDVFLSRISNNERGDILFDVLDGDFYAVNYVLVKNPQLGGKYLITPEFDGGSVPVVGLNSTPTSLCLTVQAPNLSLDGIFSWIVGSPTISGFNYGISSDLRYSGYFLNYAFSTSSCKGGQIQLEPGISSGSIANLAWPKPPTSVVLTVQVPDATYDGLFSWVINSPTATGFSYQLSGLPKDGNYILNYLAEFEDLGRQLTLLELNSISPIYLSPKFQPEAIILTSQAPSLGDGLFAWTSMPYGSRGYFCETSALTSN